MPREPIPTHAFALVVVRHHDGRFLLVQEAKHGQTWYPPAGRVDPGETITETAIRGTREEAGADIELTGVLRVEHTPTEWGQCLRVIFLARPVEERAPIKTTADEHSLRAAWVTLDDIFTLRLRGSEVFTWCKGVSSGAIAVAPITLFGPHD